jgi:hypothetical protein
MRTLLILLVILVGCSSTPDEDGPKRARLDTQRSQLPSSSREQILAQAKELMTSLEFKPASQEELLAGFVELLDDEELAALIAKRGVQAVGSFRGGTGGFLIVKGIMGSGRIQVGPAGSEKRFMTRGMTGGIMLGSRSFEGVFVVVDLHDAKQIDQTYTINMGKATLAGAGALRFNEATPSEGEHTIYFVTRGKAASVDVGRGRFGLTLQ